MIRNAYIAPTESPPSLLDVKRALLTYDRVFLPDPEDRDIFPGNAFFIAMGAPPIFGGGGGNVRRIGKVKDYDDGYDTLLDELAVARRQGIIDVQSTFNLQVVDTFTIGGVDMGGYPIRPDVMLASYRNIASDPEFLKLAVNGDRKLLSLTPDIVAAISEEAGFARADGQLNNSPPLPLMKGHFRYEELRAPLTVIARGRIAAATKTVGFCAAKNLVPVFTENNFAALVERFTSRATEMIDTVAADDPYWSKRSRALKIAHDEYLDDAVLNDMTVDDVLKLRTKAWGDQAEARDGLLDAVALLSKQDVVEAEFDQRIRDLICDYRAQAAALEEQRRKLSFQIKCDIAQGTFGTAAGVGGAEGYLSQIQTGVGALTVLLAGCVWAVQRLKDHKPLRDALRGADAEFNDNACFGVHNFYSRTAAASAGGYRSVKP